jgi:hypothetical protein
MLSAHFVFGDLEAKWKRICQLTAYPFPLSHNLLKVAQTRFLSPHSSQSLFLSRQLYQLEEGCSTLQPVIKGVLPKTAFYI